MAQPSSPADADSTGSYQMVFIDTSLNTHFGLSFSLSDTVSDLKKKILVEHPNCFPKLGEIKIHALKLKRRGKYYHLSDSVNINNVLNRVDSNRYLSLDASRVVEHQHSEKLHIDPRFDQDRCRIKNNASPDGVHLQSDGASRWLANSTGLSLPQIGHIPCANEDVRVTERFESSRESSKDPITEVKHISDNHCKLASPVANTQLVLETRDKCDLSKEDLEGPDKQIKCMDHDSRDGITDVQCKLLLEGTTQNEPTAKENKKKEDAFCDAVVKENEVLAGDVPKNTLQHDVVVAEDTRMENGSVVQEHCRSSSSDASKQLDSGVQKTKDMSKGMGASVQQTDGNIDKSENGVAIVKCNNLLGVNLEYNSPAKKKPKRLGSGEKKTNDVYEGIEVSVHSSPMNKKCKAEENNSKDGYKDMMAPEYSLGEKIESKNAASQGLSVECAEDICSLRTSASTGKRKRKSSDPHTAVAADLSPVKESREESSQGMLENNKDSGETEAVVTGKSAPSETITKVNSLSLKKKHDDPVKERNIPCSSDVDMGDPNACDVGAETNVSGVEKMDTSRSCHVYLKDMPSSTVQELKGLESNTEVFVQENTTVEYHERTGLDKTDGIKEAIGFYLNDNTEDKAPEPTKSSKKAKKTTRIRKAGCGTQIISSMENTEGSIIDVGLTEVHKSVKADYSSEKSNNDGSIASHMKGNDVSSIKTDDISPMATDGESEKRAIEEVASSQEISKSQAGGANVDGKKNTKKMQTDIARSLPEVQEKDQDLGLKSSILLCNTKVVDVSSERTEKTKLAKSSSLDPKVVHVKDGAADSLDAELVSGTDDCSQVPSHVIQDNDAGQALEPVGTADSRNSGYVDEGNNQKEVFCEGIHDQDEQEVKSADKVVDNAVIRDHKSDQELKIEKNREKLAVHLISESPNLQSSVKVNLSRGSESKSEDGDSSTIKHPRSLLKESSEPLLQSKKKALEVSGSRMTPAPSSDSLKLSPVSKEPRKPNILIASGFSTPMGKHEVFAEPSSSLNSSQESTQRTKESNKHQSGSYLHPRSVGKSSGGNFGEVVKKTEGNKSLLATSSSIFQDDSSKSSSLGGEAGVDSDASTSTPSNYCSSYFSDEESNASQNGSDSSEGEEDGRKNFSQTFSSVPKSMKLDAILRSSSSYKKFKLSQPEDSESHPMNFVPDSEESQ